jgi:hypothetical protein
MVTHTLQVKLCFHFTTFICPSDRGYLHLCTFFFYFIFHFLVFLHLSASSISFSSFLHILVTETLFITFCSLPPTTNSCNEYVCVQCFIVPLPINHSWLFAPALPRQGFYCRPTYCMCILILFFDYYIYKYAYLPIGPIFFCYIYIYIYTYFI